jgi:hypothetical protein
VPVNVVGCPVVMTLDMGFSETWYPLAGTGLAAAALAARAPRTSALRTLSMHTRARRGTADMERF